MNTHNKVLKIVGYVAAICIILLVAFNIYGRTQYNPSGLLSEAAPNQELQVGKNTVEYLSNGDSISAFLFIPEDYVQGEKRPAIVVTPPHTGVKEQTAGMYAEELSKKGYITLAFDPRGFGASGGHRGYLSSPRQIEDLERSFDYLLTLEHIDAEQMFSLGMCAGSGVAAYEAMNDSRIQALAIVSPYLTGARDNGGESPFIKNAVYALHGFLKTYHALTGGDVVRSLVPTTDEEAKGANAITKGMMEYYLPGTPGGVPNWSNDLSALSVLPVIEFSIFDYPRGFDTIPTLTVYGSEAVSKDGAMMFYDMVGGPKEELVLEGAGHFELYWMPEYVGPAVEKIDEFFKKYGAR